jgi:uncharacterized RDD family membrane protein YckC
MERSCQRCAAVSASDLQYCGACGAALATAGDPIAVPVGNLRPCPSCRNQIAPNAKLCPSCGHDFVGAQQRYAGFWIRVVASIIDSIIVSIPNILILSAAPGLGTAFILEIALGFVYHVAFWNIAGATPGKMLFGMRVVMTDGSPITPGAAVVRYLGYLLSSLTLGIGYLMVAFSAHKRGLHDNIAGTIVILR